MRVWSPISRRRWAFVRWAASTRITWRIGRLASSGMNTTAARMGPTVRPSIRGSMAMAVGIATRRTSQSIRTSIILIRRATSGTIALGRNERRHAAKSDGADATDAHHERPEHTRSAAEKLKRRVERPGSTSNTSLNRLLANLHGRAGIAGAHERASFGHAHDASGAHATVATIGAGIDRHHLIVAERAKRGLQDHLQQRLIFPLLLQEDARRVPRWLHIRLWRVIVACERGARC